MKTKFVLAVLLMSAALLLSGCDDVVQTREIDNATVVSKSAETWATTGPFLITVQVQNGQNVSFVTSNQSIYSGVQPGLKVDVIFYVDGLGIKEIYPSTSKAIPDKDGGSH